MTTRRRKPFEPFRMESMFEVDKTISEEVTLEARENRPLYQKLVEKALAPIRPFA